MDQQEAERRLCDIATEIAWKLDQAKDFASCGVEFEEMGENP